MILFILPSFSGGGAERVVLNIFSRLYLQGHDVELVVFCADGPLLEILPDGVVIHNLKTYTLKRSIIPLVQKVRQLKPGVIFSTFGYINVTILAIRWLFPRKTEIWVREANLPSISIPNNHHPKLMYILYRLLYRLADKVICTSERMKSEFISNFLVSKRIVEILQNPVDVNKIHDSIRSIERFDKGGVCYVSSGRLTFQKGFDLLIYWFSELDNKKSTLVILGEGSLKNELIGITKSLNLQSRVKFVGFCNNPWKWYAGADAFLLSSRWEGMPNSVLESLACGTPVIATEKSGGVKEIIGCSKDNSVIIPATEKQFIESMNTVRIKDLNAKVLSLLPKKFEQENVVYIFVGWLEEYRLKNNNR
jgi:glycosyltransferase involved in cell wall biosynthesis